MNTIRMDLIIAFAFFFGLAIGSFVVKYLADRRYNGMKKLKEFYQDGYMRLLKDWTNIKFQNLV